MFQNCLFMLGSCDLSILAGGELGVWRGHLVRGRASRGVRGMCGGSAGGRPCWSGISMGLRCNFAGAVSLLVALLFRGGFLLVWGSFYFCGGVGHWAIVLWRLGTFLIFTNFLRS